VQAETPGRRSPTEDWRLAWERAAQSAQAGLFIAAGMSNSEIAADLHLSEGTVKIHVGRIFAKLGLRDRVQAFVLAYESRLITPRTDPLDSHGDRN
jgi:hypothetical protein